jgi:hypothetical protein
MIEGLDDLDVDDGDERLPGGVAPDGGVTVESGAESDAPTETPVAPDEPTSAGDDVEDGVHEDDQRRDARRVPSQPALSVLVLDQRELVDATDPRLAERSPPPWDLRRGFPDRRRAILWYQRAVVRTLGRFAEHVDPLDLARDRTLVDALVAPGRGSDEETERRRRQRRRIEDQSLQPAMTRAYNDLKGHAGEYVESFDSESDAEVSTSDLDPERQSEVAMRPAFSWLDARQSSTLCRLWGGFESRDALRTWLHGLNRAANGTHDRDLASRVMRDRHAVACLVDPGALDVEDEDPAVHARRFRERFAVAKLLPAFVEAISQIDGGELAKTRRTSVHTFQFD